jgi:hypothetical protein
MKKKDKHFENETCSTGGCSANYIWLGVAVILFVMAAAFMFGN